MDVLSMAVSVMTSVQTSVWVCMSAEGSMVCVLWGRRGGGGLCETLPSSIQERNL